MLHCKIMSHLCNKPHESRSDGPGTRFEVDALGQVRELATGAGNGRQVGAQARLIGGGHGDQEGRVGFGLKLQDLVIRVAIGPLIGVLAMVIGGMPIAILVAVAVVAVAAVDVCSRAT